MDMLHGRDEINARLSRNLDQEEWDAIQERDLEADLVAGADHALDDAVEWIKARRRGRATDLAVRVTRDPSVIQHRADALSILFATEAAERNHVVDFRREVLRGRLLQPEGVRGWVKRRSKTDGPGTMWVSVPVREDREVEWNSDGIQATVDLDTDAFRKLPAGWTKERLTVLDEHGVRVTERLTLGGTLERLRQVGAELARVYPWPLEVACTFVLTGAVYRVPPVKVTTSNIVMTGTAPSSVARITLEVDPATTPEDVADAYGEVRSTLFGGRRHRSLSVKHMQLAAHDLLQPSDASTDDRMESWNDFNPDSPYTERTQYRRDVKTATAKLRELPIDWRRLLQEG